MRLTNSTAAMVAACAAALLSLASGITYSFSSLIVSYANAFDASRSWVSLAFSISEFVGYLAGFGFGVLVDRYSIRAIATSAVGAFGLFFAASACVHSFALFFLFYTAGVGLSGGALFVACIVATQRLPNEARGMASALASCGVGIGIALGPMLFTRMLTQFTWQECQIGASILVLVVGLPAALGLAPKRTKELDGISPPSSPPIRARYGSPPAAIVALYAASLGVYIAFFFIMVHFGAMIGEAGGSFALKSAAYPIIGISSIAARLLCVFCSRQIATQRGRILAFSILGLAVGFIGVWTAGAGGLIVIPFCVIFGLSTGTFVALNSAFVVDVLGQERLGTNLGFMSTATGVGGLLGPMMGGFAHDAAGDYQGAVVAVALLLISSFILICRFSAVSIMGRGARIGLEQQFPSDQALCQSSDEL